MKLNEAAERVKARRNEKWKDAWDEWELTTFVDHVIAKLKRAWNSPREAKECLIDAYNYADELKRRLKTAK